MADDDIEWPVFGGCRHTCAIEEFGFAPREAIRLAVPLNTAPGVRRRGYEPVPIRAEAIWDAPTREAERNEAAQWVYAEPCAIAG